MCVLARPFPLFSLFLTFLSFPQIEPLLYKVIHEVFDKGVMYDSLLVPQWVDTICDRTMSSLAELQKPYKYIVTCQIMQKTGAGIHTANSAFWNREDDNICQVVWPNTKKVDKSNARLYCIITAIGLAL